MSWIDEVDLSTTLSPNEADAFKTTMGDYKSLEDALVGGYNAKKLTGKPFKLPENLDKLDEKTRTEFKNGAMKVLGIESPVTEDTLKGVNFKKGLAEGKDANEQVASKLKEFAVKNGMSLTKVQNLVEFVNSFGEELGETLDADNKQAIKTAVVETGKVLDLYFGAEKRKELATKLKEALQNNCDLSKEEFDALSGDLAEDGYIFRKPALAKVLMSKIAPLAKEGSTETHGAEKDKTEKSTEDSLVDEGFTRTAPLIMSGKRV